MSPAFPLRTIGTIALRLLYAILASAAIVALAVTAVFTTDQPRMISLIVEPLSLLLIPGLVVSLITAGSHDFAPSTVLDVSFLFYLIAIYLLLARRRRVQRSGPRG